MDEGVSLMQITFYNDCDYVVNLSVECESIIIMQPRDKAVVNCEKNDIHVCVKRNSVSYKKKNKYTLVLETQYQFVNVHNNDLFRITYGKERIEGNVYYDRLFLDSDNAMCTMELHNVLGDEEIKKKYNKSQKRYRLFISPFENLTGLVILLTILGIILGNKLGGIFLIIYVPVAYIFLLFIDWFMEKIIQLIFGKISKLKDEKTEFYEFFENEYIINFYSNSAGIKNDAPRIPRNISE